MEIVWKIIKNMIRFSYNLQKSDFKTEEEKSYRRGQTPCACINISPVFPRAKK